MILLYFQCYIVLIFTFLLVPLQQLFISDMLLEKIETLLKEVSELKASNAEELEQLRLKYLSKKGIVKKVTGWFK